VTFSENDLWISLRDWETTTFAIRVDTKDDDNINWAKFNVSIPNIWTDSSTNASVCSNWRLCIKETQDDKYITDITPSSISFNNIEWQTSSVTLTNLSLSTDKSVVVWSSDIVAADFELKADETSAIKLTDLTVEENDTSTNTWFTSTDISEIKLWKKEWTNETLLATKWWSQINSNALSFDDLNVTVPADETVRLIITVSTVDNASAEWRALKLKVMWSEMTLEDDDSDTVTVSTTVTSDRLITFVWKWTFDTFAFDNSDSEINNANLNVLADTTTPFVASVELKTNNESIKIKDLLVNLDADYSNQVDKIMIYDNDKTTLLATENVTWTWTTFNNIDYVVPETTTNIYFKLKLNKIGKDFPSTEQSWIYFADIDITDAEWIDSWDTIASLSSLAITWTSTTVDVLATKISNVELVNSYNWTTVTTDLDNWSQVIAIVKVTADSTTNTSTWWSAISAVLKQIKLDLTSSNWSWSSLTATWTIERIWGNGNSVTAALNTSTWITFISTELDNLTSDIEISWDSYFKITANISWLYTWSNDPSWYLDVDMDSLNASNVVFESCTDYTCSFAAESAANRTALNFKNKTSIDTPQISQVK